MAIHSQFVGRKRVNSDGSKTVVWIMDWAQQKLSAEELAEFMVAREHTFNLITSLREESKLFTKPLVIDEENGASRDPANVTGFDMFWTADPNSVQWDENWIKYRTRYESDPDLID